MNKEKILGFNVCTDNDETLLNNIFQDYINNEQVVVASINPEIIIKNYKNTYFTASINSQKYQIPDGIGIVYSSKINNGNIKQRITGIDLMQKICDKSRNYNSKIFLYGAKEGIAEKAKVELEKLYPNVNIVETCNGYIDENIAFNKINDSEADIVFVALGSPKQEEFILDYKSKLKNVKIFMPVGGSFDVISKTLKRAPNWMIKRNLEWLYRVFKQPKRIFRHLRLIKFITTILFKRITGGKNNE